MEQRDRTTWQERKRERSMHRKIITILDKGIRKFNLFWHRKYGGRIYRWEVEDKRGVSVARWKMLQREVYKRDNKLCQICFAHCPRDPDKKRASSGTLARRATFDHIIPIHKGGQTVVENLRLLCHTCHEKKSHEENLDQLGRTIELSI